MGHSESKRLNKVQEWVTLNVKSSLEEAADARQGGGGGGDAPLAALPPPAPPPPPTTTRTKGSIKRGRSCRYTNNSCLHEKNAAISV